MDFCDVTMRVRTSLVRVLHHSAMDVQAVWSLIVVRCMTGVLLMRRASMCDRAYHDAYISRLNDGERGLVTRGVGFRRGQIKE
jgi:hypothetical protein